MAEAKPRPNRDDRALPEALASERALLGAALLSAAAVEHVPDPGDFLKPAHQHIAFAIRRLAESSRPVDIVLVADQLARDGLLDEIGGLEAVAELIADTPALGHAAHYARAISDQAQARRLIAASAELADSAYRPGVDVGSVVEATISRLNRISSIGDVDGEASTLDFADIAQLLSTDLKPEKPTMLVRTDGGALLYPGKMHSFIAETTSGKGWVAVKTSADILAAGGAVVYIDHEDSPKGVLGRFLKVGAEPKWCQDRLCYVRPSGKFDLAAKRQMKKRMDRYNPDLIIVDAWIGSLTAEGLSEDLNVDIETWADRVGRWLVRESAGAAVLVLDHVVKDPENRGRYGRGAGHKLGVLDGAAYAMKTVIPFSQERSGRTVVTCSKDRPGNYYVGETVADIDFEPAALGEMVTVTVRPHTASQRPSDPHKPTIVMTAVSHELAQSSVSLTGNALKALFPTYNPKVLQSAIARLIAEGFIRETRTGRGRTVTLEHVRLYGVDESDEHLFDPDVTAPDAVAEAEYRAANEHLSLYPDR